MEVEVGKKQKREKGKDRRRRKNRSLVDDLSLFSLSSPCRLAFHTGSLSLSLSLASRGQKTTVASTSEEGRFERRKRAGVKKAAGTRGGDYGKSFLPTRRSICENADSQTHFFSSLSTTKKKKKKKSKSSLFLFLFLFSLFFLSRPVLSQLQSLTRTEGLLEQPPPSTMERVNADLAALQVREKERDACRISPPGRRLCSLLFHFAPPILLTFLPSLCFQPNSKHSPTSSATRRATSKSLRCM